MPSRIKRDRRNVQALRDTVSSVFVNSFSEMELISLSKEIAPTDKTKTDLLDDLDIGETTMNKFTRERLVNTTTQFLEPLRTTRVGID